MIEGEDSSRLGSVAAWPLLCHPHHSGGWGQGSSHPPDSHSVRTFTGLRKKKQTCARRRHALFLGRSQKAFLQASCASLWHFLHTSVMSLSAEMAQWVTTDLHKEENSQEEAKPTFQNLYCTDMWFSRAFVRVWRKAQNPAVTSKLRREREGKRPHTKDAIPGEHWAPGNNSQLGFLQAHPLGPA
jgi:hypothetical protein